MLSFEKCLLIIFLTTTHCLDLETELRKNIDGSIQQGKRAYKFFFLIFFKDYI